MIKRDYDQKGRVEAKWLNLKYEKKLYRLILGCNAAKKKPNRTKLNQLNQITHKYLYKIYVYTINSYFKCNLYPQLVLFDRLP